MTSLYKNQQSISEDMVKDFLDEDWCKYHRPAGFQIAGHPEAKSACTILGHRTVHF